MLAVVAVDSVAGLIGSRAFTRTTGFELSSGARVKS